MRPRSDDSGLTLLGRRIGEVRRTRGWTQEEFAKRIETAYKHEQQIEYGNVNISARLIFRIANELHVPAMTLFDPCGGDPKPIGRPPRPRSKVGRYQRSRYRGVHGRWGLWYAVVIDKGVAHRLGSFETQRAAAKAYDAKAKRIHGRRARLNFPSAKAP
jgi:DNA-binding XRE family transcriptional regulator